MIENGKEFFCIEHGGDVSLTQTMFSGAKGCFCVNCYKRLGWKYSDKELQEFVQKGISRSVEDFDVDYVSSLPSHLQEKARDMYKEYVDTLPIREVLL